MIKELEKLFGKVDPSIVGDTYLVPLERVKAVICSHLTAERINDILCENGYAFLDDGHIEPICRLIAKELRGDE